MSKEDTTMKRISKDDPRFTAKALGERSEELDELEVALEDLTDFEETQALARELESEFGASEDDATLSAEQLKALEQVSREPKASKRPLLAFPQWTYGLAASIAIGGIIFVAFREPTVEPEFVFEMPKPVDRLDRPEPLDTVLGDSSKGVDSTVVRSSPLGYAQNEPELGESNTVFPETSIVVEAKEEVSPTIVLRDEIVPNVAEAMQEGEGIVNGDGRVQAYFDAGGARLSGDRNDSGAAITVVTQEFMEDVGGTGNAELLSYGGTDAGETRALGDFATSSEPLRMQRVFQQPIPAPKPAVPQPFQREGYDRIEENEFMSVLDNPLSTFSIDVDTASYANMRRMIESGTRPNPDAIRIEELINYFQYDYAQPDDETPFSVNVESAAAPWKSEHHLLRIGLKGLEIEKDERPAANLVFLVDVSGSMGSPNKLPLAQESLKLLVEQMGEQDRIAIVVYAGASGLSLPSTTANNQETIRHAIDNLRSGGSTNGGAGIQLAYKVAAEKFIEGGINRVVLCTDGDFNVGMTDDGSLTRLIETKAKSGVFFSAIGFGRGNYQDSKMEQLSNKGNGNYAYIDGKQEARKVFVDDMLGTLHTIAKDVKIQVDFNPAEIQAYRLIGYVNRKLAKEDFNDDKKDAGEIGAGHTVTALYEVVPTGVDFESRSVDASKYQRPSTEATNSKEWLTVKLRYKQPDGDTSSLLEVPFEGRNGRGFDAASDDFRFAASVAGFGMLLRDSERAGDLTMADVIDMARQSKGRDERGLRGDFVELARKARELVPAAMKTESTVIPQTGTPYVVKRGDTLSSIAREYGSRVDWIQDANQISSPRHLIVGRKLFIPQD